MYGVDGRFAFYDDFSFIGYFAKTQTSAGSREDQSYLGSFEYTGDRYGLSLGELVVEDNFIPEIGFVRRDNFRRRSASAKYPVKLKSS